MGTSAIIAIVTAVLGALGVGVSAISKKKSQQRQHEYEKENMAIQNNYQLAQWGREIAYNTPSAVSARYESAGINPQGVLGSGAINAGLSGSFGSAPSATTSADSSAFDLAPAQQALSSIAGYDINSRVAASEIAKNEAQAQDAIASANKKISETPTTGNLGDAQLLLLGSETELNKAETQLASAHEQKALTDTEFNEARTILTNIQSMQASLDYVYDKATFDDRVKLCRTNLLQSIEDYEHSKSNNPIMRQYYEQQIKCSIAQTVVSYAQASLMSKQGNLVDKQGANIDKNTELLSKEIAHFVFKDAKVQAEIQAITARTTTENEMRGYRKAESIVGMINDTVGTVIDGFSAYATMGMSEAMKGNADTNRQRLNYDYPYGGNTRDHQLIFGF